MSGIIHSYYVVAMAPAVGALAGAGVVELWNLRTRARLGGLPLAAAILGSAATAWWLLDRTPDFAPGLGLVILVVGALVALVVAVPAAPHRGRIQLAAAGLGVAMLLAGPGAYALDTMATAYGGGDPSAGPATADDGSRGSFAGGPPSGGQGQGDGQGLGDGQARGVPGAADGGTAPIGGAPAGVGADGGSGASDSALVSYLLANRGDATWIVATWSANGAGSIELASRQPVMAMGGFSGSDPAPTLDQLKAYVASGQLRYVLLGSGGGGGMGGASDSTISTWVTSAGTVVDYGGSAGTLYDMSGAATAAGASAVGTAGTATTAGAAGAAASGA
jgi:hypothetical protein